MNAWIGLIGTLLGTLIGGGIASHLASKQFSNQREQEREKRLIEKYEEIHENIVKLSSQVTRVATSTLFHVGSNNKIDPKNFEDFIGIEHLQMLVDFYAPSLRPEIDAINVACQKIIRLMVESVVEENRTPAWVATTAETAALFPQQILSLSNAAKSKLSSLANDLTK